MATRQPDLTAPRQERSRATRERILGALARLLERTTFDQISVAEITAAAGCSMSSFYARFPTKGALLEAFLDRFFELSAGEVTKALSQIAAAGAGASPRARRLVELMLRSYRDYRGLLRSLILHDRTHPDTGFGSRTRAYKEQVSAAFLALLLGEEAAAANPRRAASASFGLWLVIQAIEQIILFDDPIVGRGRISERELVEQLTAVLLRTLEPPEKA
ncbi:MAG TPA: TetR/AcrR family transcriptional regulator [Thermoanaerobaculia bacterium]|nr:TetR/AcrR family transcriptional regulator [Thermoanaerobaculia bacterium]